MADPNQQQLPSNGESSFDLNSYTNELVKKLFDSNPQKTVSGSSITSAFVDAGLDPNTITAQQAMGVLDSDQFKYWKDAKTFGTETPWYKDSAMLGNIAGLGATAAQLIALPSQLKNTRLQNKALQQNINTAKQEQARRNTNISAFNAYRG
jgi:hypothetical protein